jgi:DNA transformation protein and related proteins
MGDLANLPNIGKICEKRLSSIGINDIKTFMETGSKETFVKLLTYEGDTCFSTLCGLEGAIQGIRWHNLPEETKTDLKKFFKETIKK